jgi:hypothetical protein
MNLEPDFLKILYESCTKPHINMEEWRCQPLFSNNDADDEFGYSVALDNDTLAVGVYYEDSNQTTTTKVIVIDGSDSTFSEGACFS